MNEDNEETIWREISIVAQVRKVEMVRFLRQLKLQEER
jgi:hypothetical protein